MDKATIPTELGTERIGVLLRKYAVPGIIAMTASSLYNMVDSMYIGRMSETGSLALSGLAISFPLMDDKLFPQTLIVPDMGARELQIQRRSVVFPTPFGPRIETISLLSVDIDTSFRT